MEKSIRNHPLIHGTLIISTMNVTFGNPALGLASQEAPIVTSTSTHYVQLLAPMAQRLEGVYVGLLQPVTKSKSKRLRDGSWRKAAAKKFLQGAGTHLLRTYLDRRQVTVAEWVALRPIFDVCVRDTRYDDGGISGYHGGDMQQRRNS